MNKKDLETQKPKKLPKSEIDKKKITVNTK